MAAVVEKVLKEMSDWLQPCGVSQELLHSAKELGRLPVAELFPTNELLQFLLFGSGCPFDQFSLELVIGVSAGDLSSKSWTSVAISGERELTRYSNFVFWDVIPRVENCTST